MFLSFSTVFYFLWQSLFMYLNNCSDLPKFMLMLMFRLKSNIKPKNLYEQHPTVLAVYDTFLLWPGAALGSLKRLWKKCCIQILVACKQNPSLSWEAIKAQQCVTVCREPCFWETEWMCRTSARPEFIDHSCCYVLMRVLLIKLSSVESVLPNKRGQVI